MKVKLGKLEKFINARINTHKENITDKELETMKNNNIIVQKIYLLGSLDGLNILAKEE